MIAQFKTDSGEDREIEVPLHVAEIPFSQYADFRGGEIQFFQANKGVKEGEEMDQNEAVRLMTKCVATICGESVYSIPFALKGDNMRALMDEGYTVKEGDELSVLRLYVHLVIMIQTFKPKQIPMEFKMSHGGKKFRILSQPAGRVLGGQPLTSGETIEVMELQRRAAEATKANPKDGGNMEFTMGLTQFAILIRQRNEQLPADPSEMRKFIEGRRKLFASLPLDKVLSVRYFFLNALVRLGAGETSPTSGRAAHAPRLGKKRLTLAHSKKQPKKRKS